MAEKKVYVTPSSRKNSGSSSSDVGGASTTRRMIRMSFEPHSTDHYIEPTRHDLISYIWTRANESASGKDIYRTGVLVSDKNRGRIRFHDGDDNENNNGKEFQEYNFRLRREDFENNMFRVRTDLMQTPCRCYDSLKQTWCTLNKFHVSTGGVFVQYDDGGGKEVLTSPDFLVGGCNGTSKSSSSSSSSSSSGGGSRGSMAEPSATDATESMASEEEECLLKEDWMLSQPMIATPTSSSPSRSSPRKVLPVFRPHPEDLYASPKRNDLITYIWSYAADTEADEDIYRTGILVTDKNTGRVRFYNGEDENGNQEIHHERLKLEQDNFRDNMFRVRMDLMTTPCHCYDTFQQEWCILKKIDVSSGGVIVRYCNGAKEDVLVSPDDLVGDGRAIDVNYRRDGLSAFASRVESEMDNDDEMEFEENRTLPKFEPLPTDPYVKPGLGDLVSYVWDNNHDYRTGTLFQKNGTIRFFDGLDEIGKPLTRTIAFHMNKKTFKNGMFRTRNDLTINNDCYDWSLGKWCILTEIDATCGGVCVRYPPDNSVICISPDDLVGRISGSP